MRVVAAAPLLFDDPLVASPELALVDAALAAQLRADMPSSEPFRPRDVARPTYLALVFDVDAPEPAEDELPTPLDEHDEPLADVVELVPAFVVVADDEDVDDVALDDHDALEVAESFDEAVQPALVEATGELPDYIVARDEVPFDVVPESVLATDVLDEEVDGYVPEGMVLPVLPTLEEPAEALPDYIVRDDEPVVDVVPEYVVLADDVRVDDGLPNGEASADRARSSSDYPLLPGLDKESDALEETETALRKIRENMGVPSAARRTRRVRRRFTVATGLCAVAALAVYAAEVELGVAHVPGWLSL